MSNKNIYQQITKTDKHIINHLESNKITKINQYK